jgi:hypothetical protein
VERRQGRYEKWKLNPQSKWHGHIVLQMDLFLSAIMHMRMKEWSRFQCSCNEGVGIRGHDGNGQE